MKRFTPCLLATLLTLPSLQAMAAADLVFTNGKVFTGVPGQPLVKAVAVENGKIIKVGSDAEVNALADTNTQRIDLAGKVLMPGMIDTHSHPVLAGLASLVPTCWMKKCPCPSLSNGSPNRSRPAIPEKAAWSILRESVQPTGSKAQDWASISTKAAGLTSHWC